MSASSYFLQFDVAYDVNGVRMGLLPIQTVHAYDVTNDVPLDDLIANSEGVVEAGSLPIAVGTTVRFYTDHLGATGSLEIVTIEEP